MLALADIQQHANITFITDTSGLEIKAIMYKVILCNINNIYFIIIFIIIILFIFVPLLLQGFGTLSS